MAVLPTPSAPTAVGGTVVASDLTGGASVNLVSYVNAFTDAFTSAGDGAQIYDRDASPSIPFAVLDDSLATFPGDTLIVATEPHIIHQMEKALPEKNFIGAPGADGNCSCNICPYMALNTMEKMYACLRDLEPRIEIEEGLRLKAKQSLDRMLEMASGTIGKGDLGKV